MEPIEMIEKVCKATNISFEEAREKLEENNWNVEETLIALEKEGKKIMNTEETMEQEVQEELEVIEIKDYTETEEPKKEMNFKEMIRKGFDYLRQNSIKVEKEGTEVIKIKLILFVIFMMMGWEILLPLMIVGLFFNFRYSIVGKNNFTKVNDVMNSVTRAANAAVEEFKKA